MRERKPEATVSASGRGAPPRPLAGRVRVGVTPRWLAEALDEEGNRWLLEVGTIARPLVGRVAEDDTCDALVAGSTFDRRFARSMVDDHKKEIADVTSARDHTADAKLKKLLTDLLPTLQRHESMAESLEKAK